MPAWINEMASFMKELDPNHLVTSGGEGFWGADNKRAEHNPQMPASRSGMQAQQCLLASCHTTCCAPITLFLSSL